VLSKLGFRWRPFCLGKQLQDARYDKPSEWMTLEQLFGGFLEITEQKRFITVPVEFELHEFDDNPPEIRPWVEHKDVEGVLKVTLEAWDKLVSAIESRLPDTVAPVTEETQYSLEDIKAADLKNDGIFARELFQRARRSRFLYFAPGLRLQSPEEFADQPFNIWEKMRASILYRGERIPYKTRDPNFHVLLLKTNGSTMSCEQNKWTGRFWGGAAEVTPGLYLEDQTE